MVGFYVWNGFIIWDLQIPNNISLSIILSYPFLVRLSCFSILLNWYLLQNCEALQIQALSWTQLAGYHVKFNSQSINTSLSDYIRVSIYKPDYYHGDNDMKVNHHYYLWSFYHLEYRNLPLIWHREKVGDCSIFLVSVWKSLLSFFFSLCFLFFWLAPLI